MAIDNTPPRLKLITTIAVITVVTLITLDFVFKSYYAMMTDEAAREKIAPTRDREELRKAETVAFTNASIPIDQAMAQLAKGARPELITPQPSEDLSPMTGWSKLPKPAPTPVPKAPEPPPASDTAFTTAGDAGAPLAADAGAPHGGARAPAPTSAPHHGAAAADGGAAKGH
jgi:hypothetical protein